MSDHADYYYYFDHRDDAHFGYCYDAYHDAANINLQGYLSLFLYSCAFFR